MTAVSTPLDVTNRGQPTGNAPEELYAASINLRDRNNSHATAYGFVTEAAAGCCLRVLEAGRSSGYLGEALRRSDHDVLGIEISHQAAALARNQLNQVFLGPIEGYFASADGRDGLFVRRAAYDPTHRAFGREGWRSVRPRLAQFQR